MRVGARGLGSPAVALALIAVLHVHAASAVADEFDFSRTPQEELGSRRLGGADRYETARAVLDDLHAAVGTGEPRFVVARGDDFPDALVAPNVDLLDGSVRLMLTPRDRLPPSFPGYNVDPDRPRPHPPEAIIVGDEEVVSAAVEQELRDLRFEIEGRFGGATRYETALEILRRDRDENQEGDGRTPPERTYLVSGQDFPDALAIGPRLLGTTAVVLTTPDDLHPAAREGVMLGGAPVVIVGGEAAVSSRVQEQVVEIFGRDEVSRIAGADRTATAAAVASDWVDELRESEIRVTSVGIARGDDFPDALAAGMWAGELGVPLLLASGPDTLGASATAWLQEHADTLEQVVVFGGEGAISDEVFRQAREAAQVIR